MQVTDIVGPVLGLPQAALEFGIRAAVTLFPVVLIFAWCFKWTPRGLFQHIRDHPQVQEAAVRQITVINALSDALGMEALDPAEL